MTQLKTLMLRSLAGISIVLFALLVITTTWQVFTRQVLNAPSTWSEEFAKLLFVWLAFLGSAFLFGERGHIAVDFLARKLSPKAQIGTQIFVQIVIIFFAAFGMVWGGILAAQTAWHQNLTALPFAIGWVYIVIPIAGVFITVFAVMEIVGMLNGTVEPYPETEDPEEVRDQEELEAHAAEVSDQALTSADAPTAKGDSK